LPGTRDLVYDDKRIEGFSLDHWNSNASLPNRLRAVAAVRARFAKGRWRTDIAAQVPLAEGLARLPALLAGPTVGKILLVP
jgi:NADPH:quinone reductase-like Zn-dependent oxidoreductase